MARGRPKKTRTAHGDIRYEVTILDPLTKKRTGRAYFATEAEAWVRQEEVNREERPRLNPAFDPDVTMAAYADLWLGQRKNGWARRTYRINADILHDRILPFPIGGGRTLGDIVLREFARAHGK